MRKANRPAPSRSTSNNFGAGALLVFEIPTFREQFVGKLLDNLEQIVNIRRFEQGLTTMDSDKKSAWLRKLDEECPYQVVLPRRQLADDSEIMDFLIRYVEKFDMYVEDDYAAFVRYCFADPLDAEIFRSRFEPKAERFRLAG
jgi:hypothetical protein